MVAREQQNWHSETLKHILKSELYLQKSNVSLKIGDFLANLHICSSFIFKDNLVDIDEYDETRRARLEALTVVLTGSSLAIRIELNLDTFPQKSEFSANLRQ